MSALETTTLTLQHPDHLEYLRVATVVPVVKIGQPMRNAREIVRLVHAAAAQGAALVVTPELSLTGYTIMDLVWHDILLQDARRALQFVAEETRKLECAIVVGLPMRIGDGLYNIAAVVSAGQVRGFVPKTYLPNYGEFQELRWYRPGNELRQSVELGVRVGTDLLFELDNHAILGIQICEDGWAPKPTAADLALAGATIIAYPSASNGLVGKADDRRDMVTQDSWRYHVAELYVSSGLGESSNDVVFDGHTLIASGGELLAENDRFELDAVTLIADIDLQHLRHERTRTNSFQAPDVPPAHFVELRISPRAPRTGFRAPNPHPFYSPEYSLELGWRTLDRLDRRGRDIINLQTGGLITHMREAGKSKLVIGLSGGLDSTLALLIAVRACNRLHLDLRESIIAVTMPGFGTSARTRSNAYKLAEAHGLMVREIAINAGSHQLLADLGHNGSEDTAMENVQARYRENLLFGIANMEHAMVLNTSDLTEVALGWCTFLGDHGGHYGVNVGLPKTLVKNVVRWLVRDDGDLSRDARSVVRDIIATDYSPELLEGQVTEDLIGPFELHDFFMWHLLRWRSRPSKVRELAVLAFHGRYTRQEIDKWLRLFISRFFRNQWKRSMSVEGILIGTLGLSSRTCNRMPSEASPEAWIADLNE